MQNSDNSFFAKTYNPIIQAAITFAASVVITLGAKLVNATGIIETSDRFPWMSAAAMMLCFALFNSVFSLSAPKLMKYWGKSIYCFMGLALVSGGFAWLISSIPIGEAGSYKWIFFVVAIGYLVFLSMMGFMKGIVEFAQREDWSHPRLRRKGGQQRKEKDGK